MQMRCFIPYAKVGVHMAHSYWEEVPTAIRSLVMSRMGGSPQK